MYYKVEVCEELPRKAYTVRTETWYYTNKWAATIKYQAEQNA